MEWHHENLHKKMKFKSVPSVRKVMAMVFFYSEGLLFVDIMLQGTTINSDAYVATLKKLQAQLSCARPHQQKHDVCHCVIMPDHTSVTEPRTISQDLDGQHCHTRLIALMWLSLITISLVN
jgi:hypothetical protein